MWSLHDAGVVSLKSGMDLQLEDAFHRFRSKHNVLSDAVGMSVVAGAYLVPLVWESTTLWGFRGLETFLGFLGVYVILRMKPVARSRDMVVTVLYAPSSALVCATTVRQTVCV